jgi:ketosteroid isomerase-like protein
MKTDTDKAAIRAIIEAVNQAHHDKDAAAITAQYAQDAVIADLSPPLTHIGIDAAQKAAWLDTWEGPVERLSRDFHIEVSGDLAFCRGFFQLAGTPKSLGEPISFWMRATVCLRRIEGRWKIVHEHESVPFYMDGSLRPAFDLEP